MVRKCNSLSRSVMTSFIVLRVMGLAFVAASGVYGGLEESLKHWETLSMSDIKRRIVKRDIKSEYPVEQLINFESYGRQFSLLLRKDLSVLSPDFKILVFEGNGTSHELHLDLNIYRGHVQGERKSHISAYFKDDQVLSAAIQTDSELYFVEPAVNLNPNTTNDTVIIYRESDLRWDNSSRCGYVNDGNASKPIPTTNQPLFNETKNSRRKRSCKGTVQNTCALYIVADQRFIEVIGRSDLKDTANKMVSVIDQVDQLYRGQVFDKCGSGFGFAVKKINLFPTQTEGYSFTENLEFGYEQFLQAFCTDTYLHNVCLGHIFTYQQFPDGGGFVLGLAYTGHSDAAETGGICSHYPVLRNCGLTTYKGRRDVVAMQAQLVTAHGHNWGSPHDSDSSGSCAPSVSDGGKYLMYPVSVGGADKNNFVFSPCSRISIGAVLETKSSCFVEQKAMFCGNYNVDEGENCDPGIDGSSDEDPCCTPDCQWKFGSKCSDRNHVCCIDCEIIPESNKVLCYNTSTDVCQLDSYCDGYSSTCPIGASKPDGTTCFNGGKCMSGECKSFCASVGLATCSCEGKSDACKRCCLDAKGNCSPLLSEETKSPVLLSDGIPCLYGICNAKGECLTISRNPILKFWSLLDLTSASAFVKFMRSNIVATILIVSLIVWVPMSCFICYLDRRADREREALINKLVEEELSKDELDSGRTTPPKGQQTDPRQEETKVNRPASRPNSPPKGRPAAQQQDKPAPPPAANPPRGRGAGAQQANQRTNVRAAAENSPGKRLPKS